MADDEAAENTREVKGTRDAVIVQLMEDVLEKLKLLGYEKELASKKKNAMYCSRTLFAIPASNANAQFKQFMDITMFLMMKCNQEFVVDKYDDPNTSVNKLLLLMRSMSVEVDFPASKLKQGHGEAVCVTLQALCNKALEESNFKWAKPTFPKEEFAEDAEVDDEAEIDADNEVPEDDEEELYDPTTANKSANDNLDESQDKIIIATVDPIEWKTELERVAPKLKARVKADVGKEWRAHTEQTQKHEKTLNQMLPATANQLSQIGKELGEALERMLGKEKYINNQFESLRAEYHEIQERLKVISEQCKVSNERVNSMSNEYATISETLSEIKSNMDDRGNSMTDSSPLVKIKSALQALRGEIKGFELRIGIVGHTLLQARSKRQLSRRYSKESTASMDPEYDLSEDEMY